MSNRPRTRKRVHAIADGIRRGPDGSAFQKWYYSPFISVSVSPVQCHLMGSNICSHGCGVSVAIALVDMHDCALKGDVKRFKGQNGVEIPMKQTCSGEPRSSFSFFMFVIYFSVDRVHLFSQWSALQGM